MTSHDDLPNSYLFIVVDSTDIFISLLNPSVEIYFIHNLYFIRAYYFGKNDEDLNTERSVQFSFHHNAILFHILICAAFL